MSGLSRLVVLLTIALLLAACASGTSSSGSSSTGSSAAAAGNAANGDKLFHQATLGKDNVPGCATCHSTEPNKTIVGPSLAGIATDAAGATKESDYKGTAKDAPGWLKEQIVNPNLDIVEDFHSDVMPKNYQQELTDQQLNDIVAYLLTLK